jgi:hypothetical protein
MEMVARNEKRERKRYQNGDDLTQVLTEYS